MTKDGRVTALMLAWFDVHGRRHLPWQQDPTPYRVWVSEVMLQQTQVMTVIPYFERFMARFPSLETLAAAPEDEVLHLWTGLGYYARARNLRACAQVLVARHGGEFPADIEAVMALPGIGRSTAGAILALSRGQRQAILDGNAKRVLARVFGIAGDPTSAGAVAALWAQAEACTPSARVGAYTQAIMDLGATLCTRSRPACTVCPLTILCVAAREGRQAELPGRKQRRARPAREATLLIAEARTGSEGSRVILLERRRAPGIWGGLWAPPQFDDEAAALAWCVRELGEVPGERRRLAPVDHAFTHFDLRLNPLWVRVGAGWGAGGGVQESVGGRGGGGGGESVLGGGGVREVEAVREGEGVRGGEGVREGEGEGVRGGEGVREGERLWYSLSAPPRVGLPQPVRVLLEGLPPAGALFA